VTVPEVPEIDLEEAEAKLRTAYAICERYLPESRDRSDILRRLGIALATFDYQHDCRTCGERFGLSRSEAEWYRQRRLTFPVRCRPCLVSRRKVRSAPTTTEAP
jgi:hypothetical protein